MPFPKRKPIHAADARMIGLEELIAPYSFGYLVSTPWGATRQSITVNAPGMLGQDEALVRYGRLLWLGITAPAVTTAVSMSMMSVTYWKSLAPAIPHPIADASGEQHAFTAPRHESGQLLLLTGDQDDDGKRRLFLPGIPRHWAANGLLTRAGWESLMGHARSLIMGLGPGSGVGEVDWLLAYPGALEPSLDNPTGVAFRRVHHVRVCSHTDKAPEVTGIGSV